MTNRHLTPSSCKSPPEIARKEPKSRRDLHIYSHRMAISCKSVFEMGLNQLLPASRATRGVSLPLPAPCSPALALHEGGVHSHAPHPRPRLHGPPCASPRTSSRRPPQWYFCGILTTTVHTVHILDVANTPDQSQRKTRAALLFIPVIVRPIEALIKVGSQTR